MSFEVRGIKANRSTKYDRVMLTHGITPGTIDVRAYAGEYGASETAAVTPKAAREIAAALLKMADEIDQPA